MAPPSACINIFMEQKVIERKRASHKYSSKSSSVCVMKGRLAKSSIECEGVSFIPLIMVGVEEGLIGRLAKSWIVCIDWSFISLIIVELED